MFKRDWIKVFHALDDEMLRRGEWEGRVGDWRKLLVAAVWPSKQEPRRWSSSADSWESNEERLAWLREGRGHWGDLMGGIFT